MTGPINLNKTKENNVLQPSLFDRGLQKIANDNGGQIYNSIIGRKINGLSSVISIKNSCLITDNYNIVIEIDENDVVINCYLFINSASQNWSCINFLQGFKKRLVLLCVDLSTEHISVNHKSEISTLFDLIERWGSSVMDIVFFSKKDNYSFKVHGGIF